MLLDCPICGLTKNNKLSLGKHLSTYHKIKKNDYKKILMKHYPDLFLNCMVCNNKIPKYPNEGGSYTCSDKCKKLARQKSKIGKKQTKEIIEKRIKNTNQENKEKNRQKTMLTKYGKLYHFPNPKERNKIISEKLKGKQRSEEHQRKIIESKIKNNTIKHKLNTRTIIKYKLLEYYQKGINQCITIPKNILKCNGRGHLTGIFNNIIYRSSYELLFIMICKYININVISAESKDFRIRYTSPKTNRKHWYYPDFYIPNIDLVVEIKPSSRINDSINVEKFKQASKIYKFIVITEQQLELNNLSKIFQKYYYFNTIN